jgi:PTH1 family peptidyl-tRNA hydrolase
VILIAGLGNPGNEYKNTKHNLGFRVIDEISSLNNIKISLNKKMCASLGSGCISYEDVIIAKPQCFMNQSGTVVRSLVDHFGIRVQPELIIVCDDMDLPVGRIRIRLKGTSGGHKGLESVIRELGDTNFIRIRIGIGKPPQKEDVVEYVLSGFKKNEAEYVVKSISNAAEAVAAVITEGVEKAMSVYNREG